MSQPKRQPGPILRTIVAARQPSARPANNLLLRADTDIRRTGYAGRSRKYRRVGGPNEWGSTSPYYSTPATRDNRWSATVSG